MSRRTASEPEDFSGSAARHFAGPWLTGPPAQRLPPMHHQFDRNRDPLIARQMDAQAKTEAQRQEGSAAAGHRIPADPPRPVLKPESASGDWLTAKREAAFAQTAHEKGAAAPQSEAAPVQTPTLDPTSEPSR